VLVDSWQAGYRGRRRLDRRLGVDALLGEQTRPHADPDLAIDGHADDRLMTS
jgi:hypothetical protein